MSLLKRERQQRKAEKARRRRFPLRQTVKIWWFEPKITVISFSDEPPTDEEARRAAKVALEEFHRRKKL